MAVIANKFKIESEIGRGSYATVFSAKTLHPYPPLVAGDLVAIKSISTSRLSSAQERTKLENEINLMKKLTHPNIVKLFGVEKSKPYYLLVMEYCEGGDLMRYLRSCGHGLPEATIREFSWQIGCGLRYLHAHDVVHRDLKPHNILLSGMGDRPVLKIADFGFARFLRPSDLAETVCGSPIYMAPEIQFGSRYSANVDLWSVGVIIYELVTMETPFPHVQTQYELAQELKDRDGKPYELPESVEASENLRDLVKRLLTIDSDERMNMDEFMKHPFFAGLEESVADPVTTRVVEGVRPPRFSFVMAEGAVDEKKAEQFLVDARDSAQIIALHLSDCQKWGDFALFELLTMMCEFLLDFVYEYKKVVRNVNQELVDEVVVMADGHAREAGEYASTELVLGEKTARDFLYEKAIEYTKDGAEAERNGDSFSMFKYQRAMAMLRPLVYSVESDEFIDAVRDIFKQISQRYTELCQSLRGS